MIADRRSEKQRGARGPEAAEQARLPARGFPEAGGGASRTGLQGVPALRGLAL